MGFKFQISKGTTVAEALDMAANEHGLRVRIWEGEGLDSGYVERNLLPEPRIANDSYTIEGEGINTNPENHNVAEILAEHGSTMTLTELLVWIGLTSSKQTPGLFLCLQRRGIACPHSQFQDGGFAAVGIRGKYLQIYWIQREQTRGLAFVSVSKVE